MKKEGRTNLNFEEHGFFGYIGATERWQKVGIYIITALIIIFAFILFILARKKIRRIKSRDLRRTNMEHDTYCITGIYIFRWM